MLEPGNNDELPLSLLVQIQNFGGSEMATWRQKFSELSDVEREEIGKWKGGVNNTSALRQSLEAVSEFLHQWEAAGRPPRDEEMPGG